MIDLHDDDSEIVDTMLYYMYHFDYRDDKDNGPDPLLLHIRLFMLADKYIIEPLQTLATEKFNVRAHADWTTPSFALALTEIFSPCFLASDAALFQHIVLETVKQHAKPLFNDPAHTAFRTAALQSPEFLMAYATDLTQQMGPKTTLPPHEQMAWYRCPGYGCQRHRAVFGVDAKVPVRFHMNCPLRCEKDRDLEWWRQYKTTV